MSIDNARKHFENFARRDTGEHSERELSVAMEFIEEIVASDSSEADKAVAINLAKAYLAEYVRTTRQAFEGGHPPIERINEFLSVLAVLRDQPFELFPGSHTVYWEFFNSTFTPTMHTANESRSSSADQIFSS